MSRRPFRWWRRRPASSGRHVRVLPVVGVPGAAATIVSSASLDPRVTRARVPAVAPAGPAVAPPGPAVLPVHDDPAAPDAPASSVGLVFADGASVELDPADPRVRTFRAAVAALLDVPTA